MIQIVGLADIFTLHGPDRFTVQVNFLAKTEENFNLKASSLQSDEDIASTRFFSRQEVRELKEEDFLIQRAFVAVQHWLAGKCFDLDILT